MRKKKRILVIPYKNNAYVRRLSNLMFNSKNFSRLLNDEKYETTIAVSDMNVLRNCQEIPSNCKSFQDYGNMLQSEEVNSWIIRKVELIKKILRSNFSNEITYRGLYLGDVMASGNVIRNIVRDTLVDALTIREILVVEQPDELILIEDINPLSKIATKMAQSLDIKVSTFFPHKFSFLLNRAYIFIRSTFNSFNNFISVFKSYKPAINSNKIIPEKKTILIYQSYAPTAAQFIPVIREIYEGSDIEALVLCDSSIDQDILNQENIKYEKSGSFINRKAQIEIGNIQRLVVDKWNLIKKSKKLNNFMIYRDIQLSDLIIHKLSVFSEFNISSGSLKRLLMYIESLHHLKSIRKLDLVLVGNNTSLYEMAMVSFGTINKVPTIELQHGLIHPLFHAKNFVRGKKLEDIMKIHSNKIAVWGKRFRSFLLEADNHYSKIEITGNPRFDSLNKLKKNFDKKKFREEKLFEIKKYKIITLLVSPLVYKSYDPDCHKRLSEIISFLKIIDKLLQKSPDLRLVIKPHPRDEIGFVRSKVKEIMNSSQVVLSSDLDTYELISVSDIVLTQTSTAGLEAMALGIPVICFDINNQFEKDGVFPYVLRGAALGVSNFNELEKAVSSVLANDQIRIELDQKAEQFVFDFAYKQDGQSSKRIVNLMRSMI